MHETRKFLQKRETAQKMNQRQPSPRLSHLSSDGGLAVTVQSRQESALAVDGRHHSTSLRHNGARAQK